MVLRHNDQSARTFDDLVEGDADGTIRIIHGSYGLRRYRLLYHHGDVFCYQMGDSRGTPACGDDHLSGIDRASRGHARTGTEYRRFGLPHLVLGDPSLMRCPVRAWGFRILWGYFRRF